MKLLTSFISTLSFMFIIDYISNAEILTFDEYMKCVSVFGYGLPSNETYTEFSNKSETIGGITSKIVALMALSQFSWQSHGLTLTSDPRCSGANRTAAQCEKYRKQLNCPRNNTYCGRGFIGLKYCNNYRLVSRALYSDDRLVADPDLVAENDSIAMTTALQYWRIKVNNNYNVELGRFGSSTEMLTREECLKRANISRKRWQKFNACVVASGNSHLKRSEDGCYPLLIDDNAINNNSVNIVEKYFNKKIIIYSVGSLILFMAIVALIAIILVIKIRNKSKLITEDSNSGRAVDNYYDDISLNSKYSYASSSYNNVYDQCYAYIKHDSNYDVIQVRENAYEIMGKTDKLDSPQVLLDSIYMPMNANSRK